LFVTSTAFRLLLFCDYGSDIKTNSQNFLRDVYLTDWAYADKETKKNLIILQENFKKPVSLKVAGFVEINMELFLQVINTSYSVIAVLQQIKK
jgi:hypothetical protein